MIEKFTFNQDFEKPKPQPEDENTPRYTEDQVNVMRELAYSKGVEDGKAAQQQAVEADLARVLGGFEEKLTNFVAAEAEKRKIIYTEAAHLARTIALKICLTESEKNSVDRVVTCMEQINQTLLSKPAMAISVNPRLSESFSHRVRDLIERGDIQVKPDDSLSLMDCRFSWATGGAEVVLKNTLDEVDRLISEINQTRESEHE